MDTKSLTSEEGSLEWDPKWEDPEDAAASQDAGPVLQDRGEPLFVNMSTTASLMTLKGSLASILAAAGTTELYASLITKLEQAVPEEDREDFAALVIQRTYRRISEARNAKKRRQKLREASAHRLQATYRGHLARRHVMYRHLAAARIQGLARGRATRNRLWKEKRKRCAKKIQRWYRACVIRDLRHRMRREAGASAIQRVYRGHVGRIVWRFKQDSDAATLLQRCYRGHAGRLSAKSEMERLALAKERRKAKAANMFQALYQGFRARERLRARRPALVLARKIRMAARVQRTFRGYLGRVQYRIVQHLRRMDQFAAAIRPIQALGRGHIVRQRIRDEKARVAAAEALALAKAVDLLMRNRGAKMMQTRWRRWTVRKMEMFVGAMAARIQLWYRLRHMADLGRQHRALVNAMSTKLQAVARGHLARNLTSARRREVRATKLQAVYRGHRGRVAEAEWKAQVLAERRRLARLARLEREAREKADLAIAQSSRGNIEVFTQAAVGADPLQRPMQIVPHYMKQQAERQAELLDPKVPKAVLEAVAMDGARGGEVKPGGALQGRSDEFGWGQREPALDPYQGAEHLLLQRVKASDPAMRAELTHFPPPPRGPENAAHARGGAQTLPARRSGMAMPGGGAATGQRGGGAGRLVPLAQGAGGGGWGEGEEGFVEVRVDAVAVVPVRQVVPSYLARRAKLRGSLSAMDMATGMDAGGAGGGGGEGGPLAATVGGEGVGAGQEGRGGWGGEARRRSVGDAGLRAGERAHLDRVARLDARMGWSRDAAGDWQRREVKRPRTAGRGAEEAGAERAERMAVYGTEMVENKAVRRRFNLDSVAAKNNTLRLKLTAKLGAGETAEGKVELPQVT